MTYFNDYMNDNFLSLEEDRKEMIKPINSYEEGIIKLQELNENYEEFQDIKDHSELSLNVYKKILEEVLKDKPKRIVDIGSNLNQFAPLFTNEGIKYIGIDISNHGIPLVYENSIFINVDYHDVKEMFKDDVVISNLCVGCFIKEEDVIAKKLITRSLMNNEINTYE